MAENNLCLSLQHKWIKWKYQDREEPFNFTNKLKKIRSILLTFPLNSEVSEISLGILKKIKKEGLRIIALGDPRTINQLGDELASKYPFNKDNMNIISWPNRSIIKSLKKEQIDLSIDLNRDIKLPESSLPLLAGISLRATFQNRDFQPYYNIVLKLPEGADIERKLRAIHGVFIKKAANNFKE
ncbi:hypothetical protein JW877_10195 [bacterium]|nr:hypothetical protein [bacterium]